MPSYRVEVTLTLEEGLRAPGPEDARAWVEEALRAARDGRAVDPLVVQATDLERFDVGAPAPV